MELVVTCEFRFYRTPDNQVWTSSAFLYQFWQRYLKTFERVIAVARIQNVEHVEDGWQLSSGDNVEFVALPYYVGFAGMLKNLAKIRSVIRAVATPERALIYRVPSQSAMVASLGVKHAYALEVVGDPYDVFSAGITNGVLDRILAWVSYRSLQRMARNALASCYVTNEYLQRRYPLSSTALSVGCSDIELPDDFYAKSSRVFEHKARNIVFVGSFAQLYKGPDLLIRAIAYLKSKGIMMQANMLGGGLYLKDMKSLASSLGCQDLVNFVGEVGQAEVLTYLDSADLFLMPSRTEGLPRALIEAMARALPCIASNVGGIPELLEEEDMVESDNWQALADKIEALAEQPSKLNTASTRNLHVAKEYQRDQLDARREAFYQEYAKRHKEY